MSRLATALSGCLRRRAVPLTRGAAVLLAVLLAAATWGGERAEDAWTGVATDTLLILFAAAFLFMMLRLAAFAATVWPLLALAAIRRLGLAVAERDFPALRRMQARLEALEERLDPFLALAALVLAATVFAAFRNGWQDRVRAPLEAAIGAGVLGWALLAAIFIPATMLAVLNLAGRTFARRPPRGEERGEDRQ